jgi:hypothetical protein
VKIPNILGKSQIFWDFPKIFWIFPFFWIVGKTFQFSEKNRTFTVRQVMSMFRIDGIDCMLESWGKERLAVICN